MSQNIYKYAILRIAPDFLRGEVLNVGVVLFGPNDPPKALFQATLKKLQSIDAAWSTPQVNEWINGIQEIVDQAPDIDSCIKMLNYMGCCTNNAPGIFIASTEAEVREELKEIVELYISPKNLPSTEKRKRQPRLISELRQQFKRRRLLGENADDLYNHLIVPNVPIPNHPDLKADFVYKNGIYRLTQTLDYRVSIQGAHQKISEACTKTVAAQLAKRAWGEETVKLAVVNIPEEITEIASTHIDMLQTQGFKIFSARSSKDLDDYYLAVTGAPHSDNFSLENSPYN